MNVSSPDSRPLATYSTSQIAQDHAEPRSSILDNVPPSLHKPIQYWRNFHGNLLVKGFTPLIAKFRYWIERHGLTEKDLIAVLRASMAPGQSSEFKFVSDLECWLGTQVQLRIDARKQAKQRRQEEIDRQTAANPEEQRKIVHLLQEAFGRVGDN